MYNDLFPKNFLFISLIEKDTDNFLTKSSSSIYIGSLVTSDAMGQRHFS